MRKILEILTFSRIQYNKKQWLCCANWDQSRTDARLALQTEKGLHGHSNFNLSMIADPMATPENTGQPYMRVERFDSFD